MELFLDNILEPLVKYGLISKMMTILTEKNSNPIFLASSVIVITMKNLKKVFESC